MFSDLMDGGPSMFSYMEGEIILNPYDNVDISIPISNESITETMIGLSIWPTHHDYAIKELLFSVENANNLIGDINFDGFINVLDVVMLVNHILSPAAFELDGADINGDGFINVLDVVQLVNIILGTR